MSESDDIFNDMFDDYMGVQYREGKLAWIEGKYPANNPYDPSSEAGKAWLAGYYENEQ
jgi:hypothetical protein